MFDNPRNTAQPQPSRFDGLPTTGDPYRICPDVARDFDEREIGIAQRERRASADEDARLLSFGSQKTRETEQAWSDRWFGRVD